MEKINFLNITINNISLSELLAELTVKGGLIVTPNVDHLVRLQKDPEFLKAYHIADYVVCDSKILQYVLKLLGKPIKEKISGSDLFPAFYGYNRDNQDIRIFLLGGIEQVAQKAKDNINRKVGREIVVEALSPSFGFENNEQECREIVEKINQSGANVLVVGVGAPKQEKWILKYRRYLPQIKLFLPVGATIDFEAGYKSRAPEWVSNIGLEWLHRLLSEPRRLWKRYLLDSMPFFVHTIQHRFNIYRHDPILELKSLPLGKVLVRAGLLSERQLKMVLEKQRQTNYQKRIGDVIKELGLLSSETVEFFATDLLEIVESNQVLRIGDYLQKAHLIGVEEINELIEKQRLLNSDVKIGELIVREGYLSQHTVDWFIEFQYVLQSRQGQHPTFKGVYRELETFPRFKG